MKSRIVNRYNEYRMSRIRDFLIQYSKPDECWCCGQQLSRDKAYILPLVIKDKDIMLMNLLCENGIKDWEYENAYQDLFDQFYEILDDMQS